MSAVETARDALQSVINPLRDELASAKSRVASIETELKPLEEALKSLDSGKKAKSKAARKAGKPCAKKQDVLEICLALVEANQPIAKADLESLAKHKITESGKFSLSGVSLRLSECLASETFTIADDETITLSTSTATKEAA